MADVLIARVLYDVLITRVLITRVDCKLKRSDCIWVNVSILLPTTVKPEITHTLGEWLFSDSIHYVL